MLIKQCAAGADTLDQSPACRMVTRKMPAAKVAHTTVPVRVPGDICAFAIPKTFLTQGEIILTYTHVLPTVTQNKKYT